MRRRAVGRPDHSASAGDRESSLSLPWFNFRSRVDSGIGANTVAACNEAEWLRWKNPPRYLSGYYFVNRPSGATWARQLLRVASGAARAQHAGVSSPEEVAYAG